MNIQSVGETGSPNERVHDDAREYSLGIKYALSVGWQIQLDNIFCSVLFMIIMLAVYIGLSFIPIRAVAFLLILILSPIWLVFYHIYLLAKKKQPIHLTDYFHMLSQPRVFGSGLLLLIMMNVVISIGFVLLFFPGVYFTVALLYAPAIFIMDEHNPSDPFHAFTTSLFMVSTLKWPGWLKTALFCLALLFINIGGALCFGVGLFVTIPWTVFSVAAALDQNRHCLSP